jgi:restriction system protein
MRTLEDYPSYREFKERTRKAPAAAVSPEVIAGAEHVTPSELLEQAVSANRAAVEGEVLKSALALSPTGFEDLVIRLLERMGYGKAGSVRRTSTSGDAGVDGIISQDPLGLDRDIPRRRDRDVHGRLPDGPRARRRPDGFPSQGLRPPSGQAIRGCRVLEDLR